MPRRKQTPSKTTSLEDSVEEVEVKKAKVENGNGVDENSSATKVVSDFTLLYFIYYINICYFCKSTKFAVT